MAWSTATPAEHERGLYFHECSQNMTRDNINQEKRCGSPTLAEQWGLKFNATEIIGLNKAVQTQLGKILGGIGTFTIDGMLYEDPTSGKPERLWYKPLCDLNRDFQIPCSGPCCT